MHPLRHVVHLGELHPGVLGHHRVVQRFYHLALRHEVRSHGLGVQAYLHRPDDLTRRGQCGAQTNVARSAHWRKDFRYVRREVDHREGHSYDRQTIFHHEVRMIFHRAEQKADHHEERRIFRRDRQTAYRHVEQKACHREVRKACRHVGQTCAHHDRQTVCRRAGRRGATRDPHNHRLVPSCGRC